MQFLYFNTYLYKIFIDTDERYSDQLYKKQQNTIVKNEVLYIFDRNHFYSEHCKNEIHKKYD